MHGYIWLKNKKKNGLFWRVFTGLKIKNVGKMRQYSKNKIKSNYQY